MHWCLNAMISERWFELFTLLSNGLCRVLLCFLPTMPNTNYFAPWIFSPSHFPSIYPPICLTLSAGVSGLSVWSTRTAFIEFRSHCASAFDGRPLSSGITHHLYNTDKVCCEHKCSKVVEVKSFWTKNRFTLLLLPAAQYFYLKLDSIEESFWKYGDIRVLWQ